MKKIGIALLFAVGLMAPAPGAWACFPCSCNGTYLGCYTSIWACYNDCMASPFRGADTLEQLLLGEASMTMSIDASRCALTEAQR